MYMDLNESVKRVRSVRPLNCGTGNSKLKPTLVSVKIEEGALGEPTLEGTQIIGTVTGATCHGDGEDHYLEMATGISTEVIILVYIV